MAGLLAACNTTGPVSSSLSGGPFRFQCGMLGVVLNPDTDGAAELRVNDRKWRMQQTRSASGTRYEASNTADTVFWDKGDRARLTLDSVAQAECMWINPEDHYMARGNEPGWIMHLSGNNLGLVTDYGDHYTLTNIDLDEDGLDYRHITTRNNGAGIEVTILKQPCRDDMSGEAFPHQVRIKQGNRILQGCGGINTVATGMIEGVTWRLQDLNGEGIIDQSHITLELHTDGRISGNSGCNNYMTGYRREGTRLLINPRIGGTMMACGAGALMSQEQRYLQLLGRMDRLSVDSTGALKLENNAGESLNFHRQE